MLAYLERLQTKIGKKMAEWIDFLDEAIIVGVAAFIWRLVDKISKRSWRTERALTLYVKLQNIETKKLHPEICNDPEFKKIEELVNLVLKENGDK